MGGGERGRRGGARVSGFFFTKNPNLKKKKKIFFFGGGGGGGEGEGVGGNRWTDRRRGPNQFAPSTSSKLGSLQCINLQVMSLTSSIYDHFII